MITEKGIEIKDLAELTSNQIIGNFDQENARIVF